MTHRRFGRDSVALGSQQVRPISREPVIYRPTGPHIDQGRFIPRAAMQENHQSTIHPNHFWQPLGPFPLPLSECFSPFGTPSNNTHVKRHKIWSWMFFWQNQV